MRSTSCAAATARMRRSSAGGSAYRPELGDEADELVVPVLALLLVVVRPAAVDRALHRAVDAEHDARIERAAHRRHHLRLRPQPLVELGADLPEQARVELVDLVEHDHVGAGQLVLEQLLQRLLMGTTDRVGGALRPHRVRIVGEAPVRHRRRIDHR